MGKPSRVTEVSGKGEGFDCDVAGRLVPSPQGTLQSAIGPEIRIATRSMVTQCGKCLSGRKNHREQREASGSSGTLCFPAEGDFLHWGIFGNV